MPFFVLLSFRSQIRISKMLADILIVYKECSNVFALTLAHLIARRYAVKLPTLLFEAIATVPKLSAVEFHGRGRVPFLVGNGPRRIYACCLCSGRPAFRGRLAGHAREHAGDVRHKLFVPDSADADRRC